MNLSDFIRDVPDFPKKGIVFKDITPLLSSPEATALCIDQLAEAFAGMEIDVVAGVESRGFIFGVPLAMKLGAGFIPIRKAGKLPYKKISRSYGLEYGKATIEIHTDAIEKGQRVLLIGDLLATGGTTAAAAELVEDLGGEVVGCGFVVELGFLPGREKIKDYKVVSLLNYDGE